MNPLSPDGWVTWLDSNPANGDHSELVDKWAQNAPDGYAFMGPWEPIALGFWRRPLRVLAAGRTP